MVTIGQYNSPKQKLFGVLNNISECKRVLGPKDLRIVFLVHETRNGMAGLVLHIFHLPV